jgi:hypothetical protein
MPDALPPVRCDSYRHGRHVRANGWFTKRASTRDEEARHQQGDRKQIFPVVTLALNEFPKPLARPENHSVKMRLGEPQRPADTLFVLVVQIETN